MTFDDVSKDINAFLNGFEYRFTQGLNTQSSMHRSKFVDMSMADYMRYLWNNPQNGQSPYKLFEGALVPEGKDINGNIIYKFNGARF